MYIFFFYKPFVLLRSFFFLAVSGTIKKGKGRERRKATTLAFASVCVCVCVSTFLTERGRGVGKDWLRVSSPVPPVRSTKVFIAVTQQLQRTCPLDVHLFSFRKSVKDPSTHVSRCFCLSFLPLKNCFLRCPHAADREMCLHFLLFLASHFSLFSPMPFTERVGSILATDFFVGVACRQRFGNKKKKHLLFVSSAFSESWKGEG